MIAAQPVSGAGAVWTVLVVVWCAALHRPVLAALEAVRDRMNGGGKVRAGQRRPARTHPAPCRPELNRARIYDYERETR